MKLKKYILGNILFFFLVFSGCISPVFAGFKHGDSSIPVDEEDFIVYDFDDNVVPEPLKIKVEIVSIFQYYEIISALVVNINVSKLKSNTKTYEVLIVDSIKFQNQTCLVYNKTHQLFRYDQYMNNLLMQGYGGYYIIPDDPVDVNIVKGFIEGYTAWSANVIGNTITIDIANNQTILTYNEQGILIKQEVISNNEIISTLTLIKQPNNVVLIVSITVIIAVAAGVILIGIIIYKYKFKT